MTLAVSCLCVGVFALGVSCFALAKAMEVLSGRWTGAQVYA